MPELWWAAWVSNAKIVFLDLVSKPITTNTQEMRCLCLVPARCFERLQDEQPFLPRKSSAGRSGIDRCMFFPWPDKA